jgi:hypothetical protein
MSIETLLLLIIVVLIIGSFPAWSYSKPWGYRPLSILTIALVVFLVWAIASDRPLFRNSVKDDLKEAGRNVADSIRETVK